MEFANLKSPPNRKSKFFLACLVLIIVYTNCQTGKNSGNNFRISTLQPSSSVLHDDLEKNRSITLSKQAIKVHGKMLGSYLSDSSIYGEAKESKHIDQIQSAKTHLQINRLISWKKRKELPRKQNRLWQFGDRKVSTKSVPNASELPTVRSKSLQSTSTVIDSVLNNRNTKLFTTAAVERQPTYSKKSSRKKRSSFEDPPPNTKGSSPNTKGSSPNTKSSPPNTKGSSPNTKSSPPNTKGSSPNTKSSPPDTKGSSPNTKSSPPNTKGSPPNTKSSPPNTRGSPRSESYRTTANSNPPIQGRSSHVTHTAHSSTAARTTSFLNATPSDLPVTPSNATNPTTSSTTYTTATGKVIPVSSTLTTTTTPIFITTPGNNPVTSAATVSSIKTTATADIAAEEKKIPIVTTTTTTSPIFITTPVDNPETSAATGTNVTTTETAVTSVNISVTKAPANTTLTSPSSPPLTAVSDTTPIVAATVVTLSTSADDGNLMDDDVGVTAETSSNTTVTAANSVSSVDISCTTARSDLTPSPQNSLSNELSTKSTASVTPIPQVALPGTGSTSSCNTTSNWSEPAASSTSTYTTHNCSSECDLWPWVLFLIFLCLIIIFMLMFLQCFLMKLLKAINMSDQNSTRKDYEYIETYPQAITTEAEVLKLHTSSASSKHVSSNKVNKKCVLDNDEVRKSLDNTKNTREKNLWNIDNDLLRSSGQNEHSYMEYKKILRAHPRSDISNQSSTTDKVSGTLPKETYHQKKENEQLPTRDLKSTSKSSSTTLNYDIKPYETFPTSSYSSKHSETCYNASNSLSVPSSHPSHHEQTMATIVKVVPRAYQLNSVAETITSTVKSQDGTTGVSEKSTKMDGGSKIPLAQDANDIKMSQNKMLSLSDRRKMETEKLKREFLNTSSDNENINSSQSQCNSFIGTYNRLQKRLEIERQRSKSGEKGISCGSFGTTAIGEGVSSATTTIVSNCRSVTSLSSPTTTTSRYYTYSKQGKGRGECVLIVNKEEGWFKLKTGSESPGNVTKVHKIIQIDSKQSLSSSEGENDIEKLKLSSGVTDTWC